MVVVLVVAVVAVVLVMMMMVESWSVSLGELGTGRSTPSGATSTASSEKIR